MRDQQLPEQFAVGHDLDIEVPKRYAAGLKFRVDLVFRHRPLYDDELGSIDRVTSLGQMSKSLGRDFWLYFTGQLISQVGSSFTLFALPLLVFELTHSATNLAITTAAEFVPYLLFGLVIGALTALIAFGQQPALRSRVDAAVTGTVQRGTSSPVDTQRHGLHPAGG